MDDDELKGLEKMTKDLRDSEAKLIEILNQINGLEADDNENQVKPVSCVYVITKVFKFIKDGMIRN